MRGKAHSTHPVTIIIVLGCLLGLGGSCRRREEPPANTDAGVEAGTPAPSASGLARQSAEANDLTPAQLAATWPPPERWKKPQRLLYIGLLDTDRGGEVLDFLRNHFAQVDSADYMGFIETAYVDDRARGYDVTVIDHDGTDTGAPVPMIRPSFAQPTLTMGVPGADICSRLRLKTGYL